ncbi:MAG: trypsin-like peptidase domain-containing protein [Armatimonadetes bacterium]|nr:trypsin-like peptidase domain-containing protein [Armatimonadota bacterium]
MRYHASRWSTLIGLLLSLGLGAPVLAAPSAEITRLTLDHSVRETVDGASRAGMRVHVDFVVRDNKDQKCAAVVFLKKGDHFVKATEAKYQNNEKNYVVFRTLRCERRESQFADITLFCPYEPVDLPEGKHDVSALVEVRSEDDGQWPILTTRASDILFTRSAPAAVESHIERVTFDHNVDEQVDGVSVKGLRLHAKLRIENGKGRDCALVLFIKKSGEYVKSTVPKYQNNLKNYAVVQTMVPRQDVSEFDDLTLFCPYDPIDLPVGKHDLEFVLEVRARQQDEYKAIATYTSGITLTRGDPVTLPPSSPPAVGPLRVPTPGPEPGARHDHGPNEPCFACQVYRKIVNAVVWVEAGSNRGTGSIIRADGSVLTNYHVIKSAPDEVKVRLRTQVQVTYDCEVVKTSTDLDLALLKIRNPPSDLTVLALGNSDRIDVGDRVYLIGHPYGLSWTLTSGVISAIRDDSDLSPEFRNLIQTDGAVHPGNSGGPLLNPKGEMVGVNTLVRAVDGVPKENLAFARPSNIVRQWLGW